MSQWTFQLIFLVVSILLSGIVCGSSYTPPMNVLVDSPVKCATSD